MSFTFFRKGDCPICGIEGRNHSNSCQQSNTIPGLHFCRASLINPQIQPQEFKFIGQTQCGTWAKWLSVDIIDDFTNRNFEQRQRLQQEFLKRKEQQRRERLAKQMPVEERDKHNRWILDHLQLHPEDRQDLLRRGLTEEQIERGGYKSVERWQKFTRPLPLNLPGVNHRGTGLITHTPGYLCPIRDAQGLIAGFQVRKRHLVPGDNQKYYFLSSNGSIRQMDQIPLAVFNPIERRTEEYAVVEGIGVKPFLTCERLGIPTVGAAGANFPSSADHLKNSLFELGAKPGDRVIIFADAGSVGNSTVYVQYTRTAKLIKEWGYTPIFAWWGQTTKGLHKDIDELSDFSDIKYLSFTEFERLTSMHLKADTRHESFQKPVNDEEEAQYYSNLAQKEEEFAQHCGYSDAKNEEECKLAFFETYPERVKRQQDSLRSLEPWNPIIQETKFINLMIDEFFPAKEVSEVEVTGTKRSFTDLLPGLYGLAVNMGGGKSTLGKQIVKEFGSGNVITFLNSLIKQFCYDEQVAERITYLWDLEKDDGRSDIEKQQAWVRAREGWMAACVESIFKCRPKEVLILEEVEKIKQSLLSGSTCKRGRRARIREFIRHLKKAKYIFCCDADLSGTTLKWLHALVPDKKVRVVENITKRFEWECVFYTGVKEIFNNGQEKEYPNRRDNYELALLSSVARQQTLLICTDSQRWGQSIERAILMVNPTAKILRVDSITKNDELTRDTVEEFLQKPNKWIEANQPDCIIYSPTCQASLDITIEDYFDAVFGCFVHLNHLSAKQLLGRLRTNAPRIIFAKTHAISDDEASNSPLPSVLAKHMFNHNFETLHEIVLAEYPEIKDDFDLVDCQD